MRIINSTRAARVGVLMSALAGSLLAYNAAMAQSTGSQAVEELVVTAKKEISTGGLAVQVHAAKDQSIITQQFIKTQVGSANFAQLINLLPGVSYTSDDPTGVLSGDFRMHGFDGAHVSFTVDGTPLNDTGNYAIYPGEYLAQEVTDHITVNMGQTEVDSPTASAIGGTVNIVSKTPSVTPGATVEVSGGSYDYRRVYGEIDTGAFGPTGLRSYVGVNYVDSDKTKGKGDIERWGVDGRFYQPLNGSDFLSVAYTYASDRTYFYQSSSLAQIAQFGRSIDYNTQWAVPVATGAPPTYGTIPGSASAPGFEQGSDSNFWKLHPNPVDFGDIRGQSRFDLSHGVTLTVDPYFFYTLANGGGGTYIKDTDPRLWGSAPKPLLGCVDLWSDGNCKDSKLFYSPSNTQTHRYGVNSSLIYDLNPDNRFQIAYSLDDGHHRQTGEYTTVNQLTGEPNNVFGGKQGFGVAVPVLDGTTLRKRDRASIANLNQVAVNYVGKFLDEKLHVNVGVRDPYFTRDLNERCYVYNGGSEYCDSVSPAAVATALATDNTGVHAAGTTAAALTGLLGTTVKYGPNNTANFRPPFKQTYHFNKILPNVGASYDIDEHDQVYATFTEGFSAPKTDDLYVSTPENVQPETTYNYGVGYRYQSSTITGSANLWYSNWNNHIVQSFDPSDTTLSIDRNVGAVDLYGLDLEGAWRATEELSFYASATLMKSSLKSNYIVATTTGVSVPLPVKGKELVLTPDQTFAIRGQYQVGDFTVGVDSKYTGRRYVDDINATSLGGYLVTDLDAEYRFNVSNVKSSIQLNLMNIFGTNYFNRSNTSGNFAPVVTAAGTVAANSGPFVYTGAPPTAYVTLKASF